MSDRPLLLVPERVRLLPPALMGLGVLMVPHSLYAEEPGGLGLTVSGVASALIGAWYSSSYARSIRKASWIASHSRLSGVELMRVKVGVLQSTAAITRGGLGRLSLTTKYTEVGDGRALDSLKPLRLKGYGAIAGFHWTASWSREDEPEVFAVEWFRVPAYRIDEPGFKGRLFRVLVVVMPASEYVITPSRLELRAAWHGVRARAEVEGGSGSISGYLELDGEGPGEALRGVREAPGEVLDSHSQDGQARQHPVQLEATATGDYIWSSTSNQGMQAMAPVYR